MSSPTQSDKPIKETIMSDGELWIAIQEIQALNHGTADESETQEYFDLFKKAQSNG